MSKLVFAVWEVNYSSGPDAVQQTNLGRYRSFATVRRLLDDVSEKRYCTVDGVQKMNNFDRVRVWHEEADKALWALCHDFSKHTVLNKQLFDDVKRDPLYQLVSN